MAVSHLKNARYASNFFVTSWLNNQIEVIRAGVPGPGQLGPHNLALGNYRTFISEFISGTTRKAVEVDAVYNPTTGSVYLIKAAGKADFDGMCSVEYLKS